MPNVHNKCTALVLTSMLITCSVFAAPNAATDDTQKANQAIADY